MKSLLLALLLVGCVSTPIKKPNAPVESPKVEVPVEPSKPEETKPVDSKPADETPIPGSPSEYEGKPVPSPTAKGQFTVNIKTENYTAAQQAKVNEAAKYIKLIFNSEEYKQEVLGFTYEGKRQFVDNKGMTNEEIYNHLKGGAEALNPIVNYQMDVTLVMYYSLKNTVGYTYPSSTKIWTNSKYHNKYNACQVASNTTHEWTHKMGFGHAQKWNKARDYSVPYGHNSIVERLCPLAKEGKLTPLKPEILPLAPIPQ